MRRALAAGAARAPVVTALTAFLAAATVVLTFSAPARAAWGGAFEFTRPGALDLLPTQLALSARGASAAGFAAEDVDVPGQSQAYVTPRSPGGAVGSPVAVAGAQQIVALSFNGSALELLTGVAPASQSCCSSVQAVRMTSSGALQKAGTVAGGLTSDPQGQLLTLGTGGMLAVVATERGVWAAQAAHGDRFGAQHRLSNARQIPQGVASAWLGGASTIVAWTAARGPTGVASPRSIYYAMGSRRGAPSKVRSLLTVPGGHRIEELGAARRGSGATVAWVESWYDRRASFHSVVRAADVAARPRVRTLSAATAIASGLDIAAGRSGDQAVSFKTCRSNGSCSAFAAVRGPNATFGGPTAFGLMDPAQSPAVGVGSRGQTIVAWIRGGRPVAAAGSARNRRFGATRTLSSRAQFAADITVAFGPGRQALVAWSQGTLNPSVVAAPYTSS